MIGKTSRVVAMKYARPTTPRTANTAKDTFSPKTPFQRVLDFVQPPGPSGRLVCWAGQAGLTEVGEGYATQQHAV
jgi:hypothetical protein